MTYEMKIELQSRIGREKAEAEARAAGMAEGLAEGLAEGEKSRDKELILKWLKKGRTMREIAEDLDRTEEYVQKLAAEKN